jgi:NADP-dependent 3-hydroxy acid dehydrogenase YdfG
MGKLEGKVAVITATSGMALATAKLFVEEGAHVFIAGRRKDKLDEAVKLIGKNVTGVQGDAANLGDLDRLYETVKREKGKIDILLLAPVKASSRHWNKSPKNISTRPSTSTYVARSSPCRRRCRCLRTTALSFLMALLPV